MITLFDSLSVSQKGDCVDKHGVLFCDGGSRGNPGRCAGGAVLYDDQKTEQARSGWYYGIQTNNFAEYCAVRDGLAMALNHGITHLSVFLDSKLIVEQMSGRWKIKNQNIKPIAQEIQNLKNNFTSLVFTHVPREKNKIADQIVNEKLDTV